MMPQPQQLGRLLGPGLLRFLLAALVVVSHLTSLNVGRPAVLLFFMLSGFWVARLLARWETGTITFLASRALRIWPLYALVTVVAWALLARTGAPHPADPWSALMLLGLAARPGDVLGVSWSLDLELQFYFALPLIALALARAGVAITLAGAALAFAVGAWLFDQGWLTFLFHLPVFLAGVLVQHFAWRPSGRLAAASVVLAGLGAGLILLVPAWNGLLLKASFADSLAENLGHILWVLLLVPFIAWNVHQPSDRRDRWLGDMSYTLYLVHLPVVKLLAQFVPAMDLAAKLLALALIALVSLAVFFGLDRPLEARRARLWRRHPA